jgi:sulfite exporter TauE/SafE/copper chaperone CopZ
MKEVGDMKTVNTREIPIKGMHCASCTILVTNELESIPGVARAKVSLQSNTAVISAKNLPSDAAIAKAVKAAGYEVGYDATSGISKDKRVYIDILIGIAVISSLAAVFSFSGLHIQTGTSSTQSIGIVALITGLTAGFSTCMALIGGLVLGVSAKHAEKFPAATATKKFTPHLYFNAGRILSFIILGGSIGMIGTAFQLKGALLGLLLIVVGVFMLVLGLSLTELFPQLKKGFTLPSGFAKALKINQRKDNEYSHRGTFLLGAVTFFLPCGFTQAMQLLAVSSGSAASGAIIMGMFAIGTTPGLLGAGGLTSLVSGNFAKRFFRVVGVAVMAMALINITNGFRLGNFHLPKANRVASVQSLSSDTKKLYATYQGVGKLPDITPSTFTTKVGQKTALIVDAKEDGAGCMSTIMISGLNDTPQLIRKDKRLVLSFTPTEAGDYTIMCAMGIPRGTITVEQ